jgi:very-short-patch-repair endonuclease
MLRGVRREDLRSDGVLVSPIDRAVAGLARRQEGMVSHAQLLAAELGRGAIELRLRNGRLHPYCRGVYSVGHTRLTARARLWAAVLACGGPGAALLGYRAAAAPWDLTTMPSGPIDVITLRRSSSRNGIRVHRSKSLEPQDITHIDGLPLTTPTRTIIDLADQLAPHRLERVLHRAEILRILDFAAIHARLAALPGRRSRTLRRALESLAAGPQVTRSELEERFLALIAQLDLPRPKVNVIVAGYEVDFYWPDHNLIVEADGAAAHLTPKAFEQDRVRDARLTALGHRVVRITWRQLSTQPKAVARLLRELLFE